MRIAPARQQSIWCNNKPKRTAAGGPPSLRGAKRSRSRAAPLPAPRGLLKLFTNGPPQKGGGAPKGAGVDTAGPPTSVAACLCAHGARSFWETRSPSGALPRLSPETFRSKAQSGPALHGRGQPIRAPGSQLLADRLSPAGRVSEPPANGVTSPIPGTAPARIKRPSPVDVPYDERDGALLVRHRVQIQEIPSAGAISLIQRRNIPHCLFDSRHRNCDTPPHLL
jgi:hypothetical protein